MTVVSVLVPARNEPHLTQTVDGLFAKAAGQIEVIVVLDGPTEFSVPAERPGLTVIYKDAPQGMRKAINNAAAWASGDYLLKLDAHCAMGQGYDQILKADCDKDWVVSARRYDLDTTTWTLGRNDPVDYFYLSCPWTHPKYFMMQSMPWVGRSQRRLDIAIDEQMTIHGGMWFMHADYFCDRIGGMDGSGYGTFAGEPLEIGMKTWLGGGKLMVNKKTWYAHARNRANYSVNSTGMIPGLIWASHYWAEDKWPLRQRDFGWFVEKFWPLPTEQTICRGEKYPWPENWKEYLVQHA